MGNAYDRRYNQEAYYWGLRPLLICYEVLKKLPPERPLRLLDIGCGEGRNAIFFARNGYEVTAFGYRASCLPITMTGASSSARKRYSTACPAVCHTNTPSTASSPARSR